MPTTTKEQTKQVVTFLVKVDDIKISRDNSRNIKKAAIEELAKSIEATGLIQPIVVRPESGTKAKKYELVAGYRRMEAFKLLKRESIPAQVIEVGDDKAQAVRVAENIQRKNLDPHEEADAIQRLFDKGMTIEAAAAELGKSPQSIARRAQLLRLIPEWKERLEQYGGRIPVAVFETAARCSEDIQKELLDHYDTYEFEDGNLDIDNVKRDIARYENVLSSATWKLDDESLVPEAGSCAVCPKRSSCQPYLFDDDAPEKKKKGGSQDKCLDSACWDKKQTASNQKRYNELKAEHQDVILLRHGAIDAKREIELVKQVDPKKTRNDVHHAFEFVPAKKTDKDAKPGIMLNGPQTGHIVWVRPPQKQKNRQVAGDVTVPKTGPMTQKEKEARREGRRLLLVRNDINDYINKSTDGPDFIIGDDDQSQMRIIISLLLTFGISMDSHAYAHPFKAFDKQSLDLPELRKRAWKFLKDDFGQYLLSIHDTAGAFGEKPNLKRLCEFLKLDFDKLMENAKQEIPRPKSWPAEESEKKAAPKVKGKKR